jgi:asparagine synthase (glutamine-hydrolysing)
MEIGEKGIEKEGQYYSMPSISIDDCYSKNTSKKPIEHYAEKIGDALKESIKLRMISDAPVGLALSGGVDSSLITGLMREIYTGTIRTYSIGFNEKQIDGSTIDESEYSNYIAKRHDTEHHRILVDQDIFSKNYLKCIWHNDEPIFGPQTMALNLLSWHASKKVKVLLGGEGADEIFAGYEYPRHLCYYRLGEQLHALKHRYARVTDIKKFAKLPANDLNYRKHLINYDELSGAKQHMYYLVNTFLQPLINRIDKTSMASGLEFRVPFLDHNVVKVAFGIPDNLKIRKGVAKAVLKHLAEGYLSHEQIYRPKAGFSMPLNNWLRNKKHLGKYVDVLHEKRTRDRNFIKPAGLEGLLDEFWKGNDRFEYSIAGRVWVLLNLELWIRSFIEDKKPLSC